MVANRFDYLGAREVQACSRPGRNHRGSSHHCDEIYAERHSVLATASRSNA